MQKYWKNSLLKRILIFPILKYLFSQGDNSNFEVLENAFIKLAGKNIIAIENCGYDIEEGVTDAFELFVHLKNNKYDPVGFLFLCI